MACVRGHLSRCTSVFCQFIHLLPQDLSDLSGHREWNEKWQDDQELCLQMIGEETLSNLVDEYGMVILASEYLGDSLIVDCVQACQTECETQKEWHWSP